MGCLNHGNHTQIYIYIHTWRVVETFDEDFDFILASKAVQYI